jgi:hypothetical protein
MVARILDIMGRLDATQALEVSRIELASRILRQQVAVKSR